VEAATSPIPRALAARLADVPAKKQKIDTENFQNFEKKTKILPKMTIFEKCKISEDVVISYITVFSKQKVVKRVFRII